MFQARFTRKLLSVFFMAGMAAFNFPAQAQTEAVPEDPGQFQEQQISAEQEAANKKDSYAIAVLPFYAEGSVGEKGAQTAALIQAYLSQTPELMLVERAQIDKVFSEMELGLSGTISQATAARVGHLVGAKIIVTGNVFVMGSQITFMSKVTGVETGRVYAEAVTQPVKEADEVAARTLALKISEIILQNGETLIAATEEQDDVLKKYAMALQGRQLPAVSVNISEEHMRRTVLDPAAETEVSVMLQTLGFSLLDPAVSSQAPDIEITGGAFSEFAARNGNLVSCKARVEIKAVDVKTGNILGVDRETDVAVDISEQIAGKLAIEKAARKAFERIIPKLVP